MTNSVSNLMVLPQQQHFNKQQSNIVGVNFKSNSRDEYVSKNRQTYPRQYVSREDIIQEQLREQQKQKRRNTFFAILGALASIVTIGVFGRILVRDIKADKIAREAEKAAKEALNNDLKTDKVQSLGQFIKFEKVVDDPLIADFTETKTLAPEIKKMLIDMKNDAKIEEKYIIAAGLEHKPFPNAAILTGPTGTGKTETIRMYAKNTKANFSVIKLTDFSNSYVNGTAGNMSKMFDDIEQLLQENPNEEFVFLFDEIDGIASKLENITGDRSYLKENRQTFIMGLEKILRHKNCKCFAATNVDINELDKAVVNRFGRNIEFKLPTKTQLIEGLKFHLKDSKNLQKDNFDFFVNQSGEIDRFMQDMVNKKSSYRDLAKVATDAQARHCRAMSDAKNENMLFDIKYLKEALAAKGKNANELK